MRKRRPQKTTYQEIAEKVRSLPVPQSRVTAHHSGGQTEKVKQPLYIRQTPIMWGIPQDEVMYSKFFTIFVRNANYMPWDTFATTESTYLPSARNEIHDQFLDYPEKLPYLQMLDSDIMFPPHMVERLIEHKLPIVGGWYKNKHQRVEPHPVVYDFLSETDSRVNFKHRDVPGKGLEKVEGMGAGCWLMTREVAEALGKSPYSMHKGTEDLILCKKLMDLGIPLYVDWDIELAHLGVRWI